MGAGRAEEGGVRTEAARVYERAGLDPAAYRVEAVAGVEVALHELERGQLVVWGDGETFHYRLTPVAQPA